MTWSFIKDESIEGIEGNKGRESEVNGCDMDGRKG